MGIRDYFTLDKTLGRDVKVVVDVISNGGVDELNLLRSDGTLVETVQPQTDERTIVLKYPLLQVS